MKGGREKERKTERVGGRERERKKGTIAKTEDKRMERGRDRQRQRTG